MEKACQKKYYWEVFPIALSETLRFPPLLDREIKEVATKLETGHPKQAIPPEVRWHKLGVAKKKALPYLEKYVMR